MPKNLDEDYVQAGFGSRLEFGKRPALITVDFVRAYLDPSSPLYAGVDGALASACRVLAAARLSHIPTIFTRVEFIPGGSDGGVFYRKVPALRVFDRGSPLGAFGPGLEPREGEFVMTKQYASAFFWHTFGDPFKLATCRHRSGGRSGMGVHRRHQHCAAPIRGIIADLNEKAGATEGQGNIDTNLYRMDRANLKHLTDVGIIDIVSGNNGLYGVPGYTAVKGYDAASGLGAIDINQFVNSFISYSK